MLSRVREFLFRLSKEGRELTRVEKQFEKTEARRRRILATRAPTIPVTKNRRAENSFIE